MKIDRAGAELAIGIPFFQASEGGSIGMGVGVLNYDFSKKIRLRRCEIIGRWQNGQGVSPKL